MENIKHDLLRGFQQLRTTAGSAEFAMHEAAAEAKVASAASGSDEGALGRARLTCCRRNSAPIVHDTAASFASSAFDSQWEVSGREKGSFTSETSSSSCPSFRRASISNPVAKYVPGAKGGSTWHSFDVVGEQVRA